MSNPLYQQYQNRPGNIAQQFEQFKKNFTGDPQQIIQEMLRSGKLSQEQFNRAVQMANQFKGLIK